MNTIILRFQGLAWHEQETKDYRLIKYRSKLDHIRVIGIYVAFFRKEGIGQHDFLSILIGP